MPRGPAVFGKVMEATIGREGWVVVTTQPAPGFVSLGLDVAPPPRGWQPGHEFQVRVTDTASRRYSVHHLDPTDGRRIEVLAATQAGGPGTRWCRGLEPGQPVTLLAGAHRPIGQPGTTRLYLGDGCTLGTIDALVSASPAGSDPAEVPGSAGIAERVGHVVAIEVPLAAVDPLSERFPRYCFLAATEVPGEVLDRWLRSTVDDDGGGLASVDGAVLFGHAGSIQRQRKLLVERGVVTRQAVRVKAYWATGKFGL